MSLFNSKKIMNKLETFSMLDLADMVKRVELENSAKQADAIMDAILTCLREDHTAKMVVYYSRPTRINLEHLKNNGFRVFEVSDGHDEFKIKVFYITWLVEDFKSEYPDKQFKEL